MSCGFAATRAQLSQGQVADGYSDRPDSARVVAHAYIFLMSYLRRACVLCALTLFVACGGAASTSESLASATQTTDEPSAPSPTVTTVQPGVDAPEPVAADPTSTASNVAPDDAGPETRTTATAVTSTGTRTTNIEATEDTDPMAPTPPGAATPAPPASNSQPEPNCIRLTDFALDAENFGWFIVNDNVMGGQSRGGPVFENSAMLFEGEINTDGGGFSSVRAEIAPTTLAGFTHLIVRARTDERTYKVTLEDRLETRDRRVSQQQTLVFGDADDDGWQTARIDFDRLDPRIFGRAVASDPFRPDLATQLGIMISDGVDGPFRIEVDRIDACR